MAARSSNFSDLIQRVTANCLLHPLGSGRHNHDPSSLLPSDEDEDEDDDEYQTQDDDKLQDDDDDEEEEEDNDGYSLKKWKGEKANKKGSQCQPRTEKVAQMEMLIGEVFEAVSAMKKAYVTLQKVHSPWDPDKMRAADVTVVAELRRMGVLRERYKRSIACSDNVRREDWKVGAATLSEMVAPYEAAVEELKQEVKAKEVEIENLKEKFRTLSSISGSGSGGKKGSKSK